MLPLQRAVHSPFPNIDPRRQRVLTAQRALWQLLLLAVVAAPAAAQSERWIVHLKGDGQDLTALRRAIRAHEPAVATGIVADLGRTMRTVQAPVVKEVERLGGKVRAQWWIVNACAVEIDKQQLDQLRALPQVLRLERDEVATAAEAKAADKFNHNVAALHLAGFHGAGAVIAIVDSGFDVAMSNSGRPHRVFFRGGDPGNTTGPGIAGSRLLFARQMGDEPADEVAGHGTATSSVSAGGGWGTQVSSPGTADGADIAAYSIADFENTGATDASQTSAWQQVLVDRATLPIVVANLSYHGTPDPLNVSQQAMDQAAFSGDILIATAAGNFGVGGTVHSGSNANGLAVAALRADFHDLLGYSTRGPLVSDPQRFFPDLAACIHSYVAFPDCELNDDTFNGTSNASPQVAGVATLLRAAVPALSAVETKAVLLAATLDIAADNPGQDRNAYGMGMLRADTAMATAQDPSQFGSATLTTTAPVWTFPVNVVRGEPYAVAIAWQRQVMASTAWSNLDLRILDGSTVVASSSTPRNLYEMARFTAPRTGTLTAEVTGVTLELGSQPFAIAVAHGIVAAPVAATFSGYGDSCAGSPGAGSVVCGGVNTLAPLGVVDNDQVGGNYEVALFVDPPRGVPITGVEMLVASSDQVTVQFSLYDLDGHKNPSGPALRTASTVLSPQVAWQRCMFAQPYVSGNAHRIAVGFISSTTHWRPILQQGVPGPIAFRDRCGGQWRPTDGPPLGLRLLCSGPGAGLAPILWNQGVPQAGGSFAVRLSRAVPNGSALLLLGSSQQSRSGVPLPIDLTSQGAPGCSLLVSDDGPPWNPGPAVIATATDGQGESAVMLSIPNHPDLVGTNFYCQFMAMDAAANSLGLATSGGGAARIGIP